MSELYLIPLLIGIVISTMSFMFGITSDKKEYILHILICIIPLINILITLIYLWIMYKVITNMSKKRN